MKFDAIIFDIDNVLVDTRASYTHAIQKTVQVYLETILGYGPSKKSVLSRKDIEYFKSLGGFNDDWDTCVGILTYLVSLPMHTKSVDELIGEKEFQKLDRLFKEKPVGLNGIQKIFGRHDKISIEKTAEIFQHFYRTKFIQNEASLIRPTALKKIKHAGLKTGIVTGRNREEALIALTRFKMEQLFNVIVTLDDMLPEQKKPDPFGLLKISKTLGKKLRYLYVGDLPDDMLAARNAKAEMTIRSCGFLQAALSPKEMTAALKKAGADFLVKNERELLRLILNQP